MSRKKHPYTDVPQETGNSWGCEITLILIAGISGLLGFLSLKYLSILFLLSLASLYLLFQVLHMRIMTSRAITYYRNSGLSGILVYSESPKWQKYIETVWLPIFGSRFEVLNWSQKSVWGRSHGSNLFDAYHEGENYYPMIIIVRKDGSPIVFRFYYAFREAKHEKLDSLIKLEKRLCLELGIKYEDLHPDDESFKLVISQKNLQAEKSAGDKPEQTQ